MSFIWENNFSINVHLYLAQSHFFYVREELIFVLNFFPISVPHGETLPRSEGRGQLHDWI